MWRKQKPYLLLYRQNTVSCTFIALCAHKHTCTWLCDIAVPTPTEQTLLPAIVPANKSTHKAFKSRTIKNGIWFSWCTGRLCFTTALVPTITPIPHARLRYGPVLTRKSSRSGNILQLYSIQSTQRVMLAWTHLNQPLDSHFLSTKKFLCFSKHKHQKEKRFSASFQTHPHTRALS